MALSVDIHKKVSGFSLDVAFEEDGEVLALLGASGCGKSMTLMCIAGIVKPDSGRIVLNGRILYDSAHHINVPPQRRRIGYLLPDASCQGPVSRRALRRREAAGRPCKNHGLGPGASPS